MTIKINPYATHFRRGLAINAGITVVLAIQPKLILL
jgi:hypothetical protein